MLLRHGGSFSRLLLAATAFGLLLTGCRTRPQSFPVGLYDVPVRDFPKVAAAGFNTVVGGSTRTVLDAAEREGLQVIASAPPGDRKTIQALDSHPALRAWYLIDEPDLHRVSPAKVREMNAAMHKTARTPTLVVLMSGSAAEKYGDTADLIAVDWYPVPWAPVATVAREMRLARLGMCGRPFFAILQAFDWTSFPDLLRMETNMVLRPPNTAELRCMAYSALMQGAQGIFFYAYETETWKLSAHPALWEAVSDLAREIRLNAPIFEHRVGWWPVQTETHGPAGDMYNEIMEARVALSLFHVPKLTGAIRPGYYLIAANTSAVPVDFSFVPPFAGELTFEASCATNKFSIDGQSVRKIYAPFEVCIFGPIDGPLIGDAAE